MVLLSLITLKYLKKYEIDTEEFRNIRMRNNFEGLCVIEAILKSVKDVKGYKKYTKGKIIEEMENKVAIFRKEHFNSAHRLFNADWDDQKNM